jgi:hypothetical protein
MKKVLFSLALSLSAVLSVNAYTTPSTEPFVKATGQFIETKEFYAFVDDFISLAKKVKATNQIAVMEKVIKNEATDVELKEFLLKMGYENKEAFITSLKVIEANKTAVIKSNEILKNGLNTEAAFKASIIKAVNDGKIKSISASKIKQLDCWLSALVTLGFCTALAYNPDALEFWVACMFTFFNALAACDVFD